MTDRAMGPLSHAEAVDLAGLYVLDALEPEEYEQVREHLATCREAHPEFEELGAVVPALAMTWEPFDAPPALKSRVMAAISAEREQAQPWSVAPAVSDMPVIVFDRPRWQSVSMWGLAAIAIVVIAVLGAWTMVLQSRVNHAEERVATIAQAIAVSTDPNADVAILRGTGSAAGASGFAAIPPDGDGYIVMVGLPQPPPGETYQAWYLVDGQPTSAGLMSVDEDGYAILEGVQSLPGTDLIALTVEVAGGVPAPTGDPVVAGEVT